MVAAIDRMLGCCYYRDMDKAVSLQAHRLKEITILRLFYHDLLELNRRSLSGY